MKKILFILSMMALAATADAQFVVSAQVGGSYAFGATTPDATFQGYSQFTGMDTTYAVPTDTLRHDNPLYLTLGFKFGYQIGRLQMGLAASFEWTHDRCDMSPSQFNTNRIMPAHINPLNPNAPNTDYEGWYKQRRYSFTIAPYLRYEVLQVGDVAFFLELNGYFTRISQPIRHDFVDWYCYEMHNTIDTTYHILDSGYSLGAKIVPGLSWQLSPHCYIDLYLDVLAFTFDKTTHYNTDVLDEYIFTSGEPTLASRTTTTVTTKTTDLGFGVNGSSLLSPTGRNWVRIGFNYTF
ncbi:MAG: hypothetical protein J5641_04150 [Bacteroidales bacterium]|nr:hypothetical protein [Bacteroidales bacterium]